MIRSDCQLMRSRREFHHRAPLHGIGADAGHRDRLIIEPPIQRGLAVDMAISRISKRAVGFSADT